MRMMKRYWPLALVIFACSVARGAVPEKIEFNRDVRPILSDNCYFCHGPDKNHRKADLRLDTKAGFFTVIDDATPVVPGNVEKSELFRRITTHDEDDHMPPKKSGKTLSDGQIAIIKKWIEQGAPWEGHWAYLKPVRKAAAAVNDPKFIKNQIDPYILAQLNQAGLPHAAEADRATLCRRIYFDLLGLPPTPEQTSAFVHDQSPNAYEKLVDQLLANPHFGERMAVYWLDVVRYSDSIGYHSDNPRNVSPYRDYVIEAFNQNKPFDQFTTEQLAGDLLTNATLNQQVASAYNRLLETTEEGGAQPKEYAAKYVADRVRNVASAWLASTMMCCECHDHKFDPFATKDFYSMEAFFADVKENPVGRREDGIPVPSAEQSEKLKELEGRVAAVKVKLETNTPELAAGQAEWEKSIAQMKVAEWTMLTPVEAASAQGATLKIEKDGTVLVSGKNPDRDVYFVTVKTNLKGITAFRVEALAHQTLPNKGPGRAGNGNFVLSEFVVQARDGAGTTPRHIELQNASADYEQTGVAEKLPAKKFLAAYAIDGDKDGKERGWAIMEQAGRDHQAVFETKADLGDGQPLMLTFILRQEDVPQHNLGRFRISASTSQRPVKAASPSDPPKEIVNIVQLDPAKRNDAQKAQVRAFYRSIAPQLAPVRAELAAAEKAKVDFLASIPKCLVTITENPRPIKILARGNWMDDSGMVVEPAVPGFLPHEEIKGRRATRLDLARWLVSKENPLTARVFVNRLWKMYFGTGLSKNLDDLGSQGEWPTHPELLDALAVEFMEHNWDIKHMVRLMVTSGTYRQSSVPDKVAVEKDPFNRLLSHQSRFRIEAEFVRDNALSIAGMLSPKIGGPSVKPYQPAGYWDYLNFPRRTWEQDHGESLYRRGLYTWWQRTFLNPTLVIFDAPSREECIAQRVLSNTPQQALSMLNDPTFVEAARVFAERTMRSAQATPERLSFAFEHALARAPRPQEIQVLSELYAKHLKEYQADPKAAQALVSAGEWPAAKDLNVPELAAWTSVSRAILNLHETITRY
jgi:hypothetical protein